MATLHPPTTAKQIKRQPDEFGRTRKDPLKFHLVHPKRDGRAVCDQRFDSAETTTMEIAELAASVICKRCLGAMTVTGDTLP